MKLEVKVLVDIKIWYLTTFDNFTLTKFNTLIHVLKASHNDNERSTKAEYYKMLGIGILSDKFVEAFFKRLE